MSEAVGGDYSFCCKPVPSCPPACHIVGQSEPFLCAESQSRPRISVTRSQDDVGVGCFVLSGLATSRGVGEFATSTGVLVGECSSPVFHTCSGKGQYTNIRNIRVAPRHPPGLAHHSTRCTRGAGTRQQHRPRHLPSRFKRVSPDFP